MAQGTQLVLCDGLKGWDGENGREVERAGCVYTSR